MNKIFIGVRHCLQAHRVVVKSGIAWVYLIPFLFSMLIVGSIFSFTGGLVRSIADPLVEMFSLTTPESTPDAVAEKLLYFLKIAGEYALYGILYLFSYYLFFKLQKYVILISMAPLMAYVSEKAEEKLLGNTYEFKWGIFLLDFWRGVRIALKNLFLELILLLLITIVISGLSTVFTPLAVIAVPLSAILMFVVSSYYYGYSSFDYLNERRRISISEGSRLIWDNKAVVVGNGAFFSFLILIPFLGIILAPILCPVGAVISAQKNYYEKKETE